MKRSSPGPHTAGLPAADLIAAPPAHSIPRALVSVRRYVTLGFATLALLFGGLGVWAATTEIAGAVLAPGTVVVESNVKKIQHPTGGVVGELLVKNGDHVRAGDVLMRLDETVTRANLQLITKQIDELAGRQVRLRAERDEAQRLVFPEDLNRRQGEPAIAQILQGEQTLFESRMRSRAGQQAQLGERIAGLREEIAGTSAQAEAKGREMELIAKELTSLQTLESKQLVTTSKLMALKREAARLEGERAQLLAAIGQSKGRIAEIEVQKLGLESDAKSEIVKDLRETEGRIVELTERRTAAEDQLKRVDIKSPVNGVVHQMTVSTVGGVVNSSEPVMLVVPDGDRLVVEAKVAPQDIEQARAHDTAIVRLPSFNQRTTPTIEGRVMTLAADRTTEPQTGQTYFVARIEIPDAELAKLGSQKLQPGMPAEVQIRTTSRTALSYFMKPLEDQFAKAFRER